jgi:hypothetical protein
VSFVRVFYDESVPLLLLPHNPAIVRIPHVHPVTKEGNVIRREGWGWGWGSGEEGESGKSDSKAEKRQNRSDTGDREEHKKGDALMERDIDDRGW